VGLAGQLAEEIHLGVYPGGEEGDIERLARLATSITSTRQGALDLLTALHAECRRLLLTEELWCAVQWLADELQDRGTLTGEEARAVYEAAAAGWR
jgi:hypothetical protein